MRWEKLGSYVTTSPQSCRGVNENNREEATLGKLWEKKDKAGKGSLSGGKVEEEDLAKPLGNPGVRRAERDNKDISLNLTRR